MTVPSHSAPEVGTVLGWAVLIFLGAAILFLSVQIVRFIIFPRLLMQWRRLMRDRTIHKIKTGEDQRLASYAAESATKMITHPDATKLLGKLEFNHALFLTAQITDAAILWVALTRDPMPEVVAEKTVKKICAGMEEAIVNYFAQNQT